MGKEYKVLGIIILVVFVGWVVYHTGCRIINDSLISRENYDPYIMDESSCRELIKVETCLNKFFGDYGYYKSWEEYIRSNFNPDFDNISDIKYAATRWVEYENSYPAKRLGMTYDEAIYWDNIFKAYEIWSSTLRDRLESYLYSKCESELINNRHNFSSYPPAGIANEKEYDKKMKLMIDDYFAKLNTPSVDYYELMNDDNVDYQVWLVSKESDANAEYGTLITVFFKDGKRSRIRLFHSN